MINLTHTINTQTNCFHCGEKCDDNNQIIINQKAFCCNGCKSVYSILHQNNLDNYYCLNETPGEKILDNQTEKFQFLDDENIAQSLISFKDKIQTQVTFYLPQIHCSSCLWLLENLKKLNSAILVSQVNFVSKEVSISFKHSNISLRQIADLLTHVGYEPYISLDKEKETPLLSSKNSALKIGVVGFCFANIMLISFPEYLGLSFLSDRTLTTFFRYMNLALALPVFFYGAYEFFNTAIKGIKQSYLNIDAPIALAVLITFIRSVYEVISGTGAGYFDSMSGIVFFMLIGRTLQSKTTKSLKFNRDYKSYFPIAVNCIVNNESTSKKIQLIEKDDVLLLHHQEIVPVDCMLSKGKALIDYSFVTGENNVTPVSIGELIYAGGKVASTNIEVVVTMPFSQSSFIKLWNNKIFKKEKNTKEYFIDNISKYFSIIVLTIAAITFIYWQIVNPAHAWKAITSVLIIACPCVLLLSSSYANAFIIDLFSKHGLFVKNAQVVSELTQINHIVFDKTGTITNADQLNIEYEGNPLLGHERDIVLSIMSQSLHPLSQAIVRQNNIFNLIKIEHVKTIEGKGVEAWVDDKYIKIGSVQFHGFSEIKPSSYSEVYIALDNILIGKFKINNKLKEGLPKLLKLLKNYKISLLSGDNDNSRNQMEAIFPKDSSLNFKQNPQQKLDFIKQLQKKGNHVLMIGDGLNDAGALKQSNIGISVVDHSFSFSPACDAVLNAKEISQLYQFIESSKTVKRLIVYTFIYAIIYNIVGIYYAVSANLQPMIAAILMTISSLSIIFISFIGVKRIERKYFHDKNHI